GGKRDGLQQPHRSGIGFPHRRDRLAPVWLHHRPARPRDCPGRVLAVGDGESGGEERHRFLIHLIARYGYALVMLLVGAEGVGLPLPGETALITAAALAAHGHLWLPGVIAASAVGVAVGGS